MFPTLDEALKELKIAEELNPGPWVKHSINVGIAARNIAEIVPGMDAEKAYVVGTLHDIGRCEGITDIPTHVYDGYKYCMEKGWEKAFEIKEYFESKMDCSIYDVLPDIGKTSLLTPKLWKPSKTTA